MDLFDYQMMLQAIKIGERGRMNAPPNPWVGCIIVKNGTTLAEGYHTYAGAPHAEIAALSKTKDAHNATVYVTLEPCSHHGRTPPCVDALIKANVARVVVGTLDPDPRVSGKGIQQLRTAGFDVVVGVAEKEVKKSLAPYLYQRTHQQTYTIVKIATSLDGKLCAHDHSSKWITGEEARIDAHKLRAESQAIITGAGTVRHDNPRLNVRPPIPLPIHPPLRVVIDSQGNSNPNAHLFNTELGPSLLITTKNCPEEKVHTFRSQGVEVAIVPEDNERVCLKSALNYISEKGILQTMVEAGPTLTSEILRLRLFQQLTAYVGPLLIGGSGFGFTNTLPTQHLNESIRLNLIAQTAFGQTTRLDYRLSTEHDSSP